MILQGRPTLCIALAALTATALPTLALSQPITEVQASYQHPVTGGEVVIHPVDHASLMIQGAGTNILIDPVGGAAKYRDLPQPELILITHEHADHFDLATLQGLPAVRIIANPAVFAQLPPDIQERASAIENGDIVEAAGVRIEAIPAYNTSADKQQFHPKGRDNGYILTIGDERILVAGDTEDTPELRALDDIYIAFLPMNQPYTMTVEQAADLAGEMKPQILYPYHHRGSDLAEFMRLMQEQSPATQIIIGNWYPAAE